jgi:hypothetical protein
VAALSMRSGGVEPQSQPGGPHRVRNVEAMSVKSAIKTGLMLKT